MSRDGTESVESLGMVGSTDLNPSKVEAFGSRMLTLLNNGATALLISIGYKTGLLETMAALPPATSQELASASGLCERYVREWLAAMYVSGIVNIDIREKDEKDSKERKKAVYSLPPENAAFLTWGRGPENVAVLSQYISILSAFEAKMVDCFKNGGGIPGEEFRELKAVMTADAAQTIALNLSEWILPLGGQSLIEDLSAGIDVLDIQCGGGINLITLAREFPMSWFTGYDTDRCNIEMAQEVAEKEGLRNVRFKHMDISFSSELAAYDLITCFQSLVESGDIRGVLTRASQALRRGGLLLIQDIAACSDPRANRAHPAGPLMYAISVMFTVPSSIARTNDETQALSAMWGNDVALKMIRDAGFECDGPRRLPDDHCNVFFFCRRE